MQKRISYYDVDWNVGSSAGELQLTFDDRSTEELTDLSLAELALLYNVLRSEKVVYYDPDSRRFSTRADMVADSLPADHGR